LTVSLHIIFYHCKLEQELFNINHKHIDTGCLAETVIQLGIYDILRGHCETHTFFPAIITRNVF
jgi:hypothetical protein